jgi:hypothetical protein
MTLLEKGRITKLLHCDRDLIVFNCEKIQTKWWLSLQKIMCKDVGCYDQLTVVAILLT